MASKRTIGSIGVFEDVRLENGAAVATLKIPSSRMLSCLDGCSEVISSDDAEDLRRYFKLGGLESFSKSPMGGMLDNAERTSFETKPCKKCGGHRGTGPDDPDRCGSGFISSNSKRSRAVGRRQAELLAVMGIESLGVPSAPDEPCPVCQCTGWVVTGTRATGPLTARPTGSSVHGEPSLGSLDIDLLTLAVCGRRLAVADAMFNCTTNALASFLELKESKLEALWWMTPAGKTMVRESKHENETIDAFFAGLRKEQSKRNDSKRQKQFDAATAQAAEILTKASRAWNCAVGFVGGVA